MNSLIFLVGLLASSATWAQDSDSALARIAVTGEVAPADRKSLTSIPWSGSHTDPLAYMVDWGNLIDPSICWVGTEPAGWSDLDGMYKMTIENTTDQFIRLQIDGGMVDVVMPYNAGGLQLPAVVVAAGDSGTRRMTALPPHTKCYGALTFKSAKTAASSGWSVEGQKLGHRGPAGEWLYAGAIWLYTSPLFEGTLSHKADYYWRGQRETTVIFYDRDF